MKTKLSQLKDYMLKNEHINALRVAAKFGELGAHKVAITTAWSAFTNPRFYVQIGKNPQALIDAGVAALKERYELA